MTVQGLAVEDMTFRGHDDDVDVVAELIVLNRSDLVGRVVDISTQP